jgi:hypothetical protein
MWDDLGPPPLLAEQWFDMPDTQLCPKNQAISAVGPKGRSRSIEELKS